MNRMRVLSTVILLFLASSLPLCGQSKPAGTPAPEDRPVFTAFKTLERQPAYRMTFNMKINDPRMTQAAAHGFAMGPMETVLKGGVHQPAFDMPGAVDDWEIRAVVKDGRGARMFNSQAIARLQKKQDEMLAVQIAMMEKQAQ